MTMQKRIEDKLQEAFKPQDLEVINESSFHQGHSGDDGTGESHFRVRISAPLLAQYNRLQRHKKVYAVLEEEMQTIHALALEIDV